MNCVWNAQLKEEVELKGEHKGGMLRARKKCTHGDCGKKHRSKFGWLTRGLKNCDKLAAKVRETQMKQHSGEQMHCNVFMARDNPKKEGVLEEPNRNKDSKSEVEFDGEHQLEDFGPPDKIISGQLATLQWLILKRSSNSGWLHTANQNATSVVFLGHAENVDCSLRSEILGVRQIW